MVCNKGHQGQGVGWGRGEVEVRVAREGVFALTQWVGVGPPKGDGGKGSPNRNGPPPSWGPGTPEPQCATATAVGPRAASIGARGRATEESPSQIDKV